MHKFGELRYDHGEFCAKCNRTLLHNFGDDSFHLPFHLPLLPFE